MAYSLGWLIEPKNKTVEIYRLGGKQVETLNNPKTLSRERYLIRVCFRSKQYFLDV